MSNQSSHGSGLTPKKMFIVVGLMIVAFLGAYNFALASNQSSSATGTAGSSLGGAPVASAGGGGGCCGGGGAGGGSGNIASGSTSAGSVSGGNSSGQVAPGGGGCCGGGGPAVSAKAKTVGGVQKISVDTSQGSFNPNQIKVKAGVPVEITFSQSGGGCLSGVVFQDFGINQDLTSGPQTIKLPALQKGTYGFTCQMGMVSGQIVAE